MSAKNKSTAQADRDFAVGRKVYARFGKNRWLLRIIEDRGKIGRNGRRLLRVARAMPSGVPEQVFEIPADDVTHQLRVRKAGSKVAAR